MNTLGKIRKKPKPKIKRRKLPKKLVSIRIDQTIHQQAEQLAKADKRSFSQYVEMVLEQHLKEQQELARYFLPGATYPVFTPYDTGNAAAQLQTFLEQHKT